jgi:hypothetical protein
MIERSHTKSVLLLLAAGLLTDDSNAMTSK